jgi:cytochrome c556
MPGETLVIKARAMVLALLLAACGGGSAPSEVTPKNSARGAVDAFMQAVADSNLTQMANLWGTAAGPAAKTRQPSDWERRVEIMRAYLQNESHRVVSDTPAGSEARHSVQVEIRRQLCTWVIPFTAVRLADGGWIVNQVDLNAAGNPARPCAPGQDTAPAAPPE